MQQQQQQQQQQQNVAGGDCNCARDCGGGSLIHNKSENAEWNTNKILILALA
jgi:hypothetical protein